MASSYGIITFCNFQSTRWCTLSLTLTLPQSHKKVVWGRVIQTDLVVSPLTRALEGAYYAPPVFLRISKKRRRAAPPNFQYLLNNQEYTLCANLDFPGQKVRSAADSLRHGLGEFPPVPWAHGDITTTLTSGTIFGHLVDYWYNWPNYLTGQVIKLLIVRCTTDKLNIYVSNDSGLWPLYLEHVEMHLWLNMFVYFPDLFPIWQEWWVSTATLVVSLWHSACFQK